MSSDVIPNSRKEGDIIKGFDVGTGANCIYPLLGASLLGWSFVGSGIFSWVYFSIYPVKTSLFNLSLSMLLTLITDVTDAAVEWAEKNVTSNPHISHLIEIRKVGFEKASCSETPCSEMSVNCETCRNGSEAVSVDIEPSTSSSLELSSAAKNIYHGPPILVGVVQNDEKFDFCMCNPPFFETMEEAGHNPKTSCGGTLTEMVCPGGEQAFISRIIQDSVQLKLSFQ